METREQERSKTEHRLRRVRGKPPAPINTRAEISVSSFAVTSRSSIAVRSSGVFYSAGSVTFDPRTARPL
jgi:hypothetical protein